MESSSGDAIHEPPLCTARYLLGLLQRGEAINDETIRPLIATRCVAPGYDTHTGRVVEALLACRSCAMREDMAVDDEGGVESIESFPGAPPLDVACVAMDDGGVSAGEAVMQYLQRPV